MSLTGKARKGVAWNTLERFSTQGVGIIFAILHHTHGVRFRDCIRHALDHGITEFEEIGAVKVLTPFVERIRKEWEKEKVKDYE